MTNNDWKKAEQALEHRLAFPLRSKAIGLRAPLMLSPCNRKKILYLKTNDYDMESEIQGLFGLYVVYPVFSSEIRWLSAVILP